MSKYIQIDIKPIDEETAAIAIAELSQTGFDGFLEEENTLKAFCKEADFEENDLIILMNKLSLNYSLSTIEDQNWNELWESNFEPVQVDDFVGIRASFHPSFTNVAYEIVITPKMSFGTGHHATTYLMMQLMREVDFRDQTVYDFGTGTGILAILAEKLGATKLLAVDNDDWCIENASENILINRCKYIDIHKVDKCEINSKYQIILANINKNIILDNIQSLAYGLEKYGDLILSGLLIEDEADIRVACEALQLVHKTTVQRNGWIACRFTGEKL